MVAQANQIGKAAMVSPWRRRRMCVLRAGVPAPASLREVSGRGAFVETNAKPPPGSEVELQHPEAGTVRGIVQAVYQDGVRIGFECGETSVGFALAAITADMSRPA